MGKVFKVLLAVIVLLWVIGLAVTAFQKQSRKQGTSQAPVPRSAPSPSTPESPAAVAAPPAPVESLIPGLMPVDVYLNLEKRGYQITKDFSGKPLVWIAQKLIGDTRYLVETYGSNASSVRRVNCAITTGPGKNAAAIALPELVIVASLPYQGAEPEKSQAWVRQNIGKNAKTTIGGVTFQLEAPTDQGVLLSIYLEEKR